MKVIIICVTITNSFNLECDWSEMAQKASDLKLHNYGKYYLKQYETLNPLLSFKANTKHWKGENCPCKQCRTVIPNFHNAFRDLLLLYTLINCK